MYELHVVNVVSLYLLLITSSHVIADLFDYHKYIKKYWNYCPCLQKQFFVYNNFSAFFVSSRVGYSVKKKFQGTDLYKVGIK